MKKIFSNTTKIHSNKFILDEVLRTSTKVNFKQTKNNEDKGSLYKKDIVIITIDTFIVTLKRLNYDIYYWGNTIYLFNLSYWSKIEINDLKRFFYKYSVAIGVPTMTAKHYKFKDELIKQFYSVKQISSPNENKNYTTINFDNGTLEIGRTDITFRHHKKEDFLTYTLPFRYNTEADAPQWQSFLDTSIPNKEDQQILAEYLGYIFIKNENKELNLEKSLILLGEGGNGKSVVFDVVNSLLGKKNVCHYSINQLTNENGYYRASFGQALLNYSSEIGKGFNIDEWKKIVSGEPITARSPYGEPFTIYNYPKLIFNANELPKEIEHNNAFFRRLIILNFDRIISDEERDTNLAKKIIEKELPGVFNWAVIGLKRLSQKGEFTFSNTSKNTLDLYKKESNTVLLFLEEDNYRESIDIYEPLQKLYNEYVTYCVTNGYQKLNKINFKKRLITSKFRVEKKNVGLVVFVEKE